MSKLQDDQAALGFPSSVPEVERIDSTCPPASARQPAGPAVQGKPALWPMVTSGTSRREFLQGGGAALAASAFPFRLAESDAAEPAQARSRQGDTRERRTLHFDLSLAEGRHEDLHLRLLRSESHRAPLVAHTARSRRRFRTQNPALAGIPDEQLTHYVADVDLPAHSLQLCSVAGTSTATGEPAVFGIHVHIPRRALRGLARTLSNDGANALHPFAAKLRAYGITPPEGSGTLASWLHDVNNFSTPYDTATSLVFLHAEVLNNDPTQGAQLLHAIHTLPCSGSDADCEPFLDALTFQVASKWPATTLGGWATLVQMTDLDNQPVFNDDGTPLYGYQVDDDVAATASGVAQQIVRAFIFDNPTFEGTNWHATQGITAVGQSEVAAADSAAAGFQVEAQHPVGSSLHGLKFNALTIVDETNRVIGLQVRNQYLRFLVAFVQYFDAANQPLPVDNPEGLDSARAKFLKLILTDANIMGIPIVPPPAQGMEFAVPAAASKARVYFGGLGLGGQSFCPEALAGSIFTLAINFGLPTMFLALGVGGAPNVSFFLGSLFADPKLLTEFVEQIIEAVEGEHPEYKNGPFGGSAAGEIVAGIIALGNIALRGLLRFAPFFAAKILGYVSVQQFLQAVPWVGPLLKGLGIVASLAALAQSLAETLANPALFYNDITLTMDTTVTISHDPNDFQFPAQARSYAVVAHYDQAVARFARGTVEPGRVGPLVVNFLGVPSGGMVKIDVWLAADDGTLVGQASVGPMPNLPSTAAQIALTIQELLIPLTAATQYVHDLRLTYASGAHVWAAAPAPTATRANLCQGQDNALCGLNGITVHTPTGMAGYGFEAGGLAACGGGPTGSFHTLQNLFLGQQPDRAFKQFGCGYATPVGIVYDPHSPVQGRHFFLQPRANGDGFDVRAVVLDDTTPFSLSQTLSWGRFTQALDALAVHPAGHIVGVNRQNHKMEILALPDQAVDEAVAPTAVPFAVVKSGPGTRAGLMNEPVAVAVAPLDGAILVLEQGNRRIQAFDVAANPVLRFAGKTTSIVELHDEGPGGVYADLGVEALGYLYVLSYINDGLAVSDYRLDVYDPDGQFLTRTTGVAAARMAVDAFRNVYTLNYESITGAPRIEPSLSQWVPRNPTLATPSMEGVRP